VLTTRNKLNDQTKHGVPHAGSSTTQERNKRRRKAREMRKLAAAAELGGGASSVRSKVTPTADPLDSDGAPEQLSTTISMPIQPWSGDIANKNKKKGFLQKMKGASATRTVFAEGNPSNDHQEDVPPQVDEVVIPNPSMPEPAITTRPVPVPPAVAVEPVQRTFTSGYMAPRLIPPSEQDLPSNVFVTFVEYPRANRGRQNKEVDVEVESEDESESDSESEPAEDEEEIANAVPRGTSGDHVDDIWSRAERDFNLLPPVSPSKLPAIGAIIGWKVSDVEALG
jgi:hypothetical protein